MLQGVSAATDLELISYLKTIQDARMRCASASLLGICVLTAALGIDLRQPHSDSAFRYFFLQVDVAAVCAAIRDLAIAPIPGDATDLDQLVRERWSLESWKWIRETQLREHDRRHLGNGTSVMGSLVPQPSTCRAWLDFTRSGKACRR